MALVCDYCGDVTQTAERVSVAFGHNQEIALKGATAREWFYYCEDDCADKVKAMLDNLRLFAMHGEGAGLVWQLVEQERAEPTGKVKPHGEPPPRRGEVGDGPPQRLKPRERLDPEELSEETRERLGQWSMHQFLKSDVSIGYSEREAREEAGTPAKGIMPPKQMGMLFDAGIATLEEAASLTEFEFRGLPGIGDKITTRMKEALSAASLSFRPGPNMKQIGMLLRSKREAGRFEVEDLIPGILGELGAPERMVDSDCRSKAWSDAERMIRDCEYGTKALPPKMLEVLGELLGTSRGGLLAEAMQAAM